MTFTDEHGTPPRRSYVARAHDRLIAEMLGLAKGIICDGVVTDGEATSFRQWLQSHPDATVHFPGSVLAERIEHIFADGISEEAERADLAELLRALVGETEDQSGKLDRTTRLPIDEPPPTIIFDGRTFCMTGKFVYGPRARCLDEVTKRGGLCSDAITNRTDYLVLGTVASPAWVQGTHGTKIERAVELQNRGARIRIIAEDHWVETLQLDA